MRKILPQNESVNISGELFELIKIKAKIGIKGYTRSLHKTLAEANTHLQQISIVNRRVKTNK